MDVTSALLRFAAARPHVLLLETPGGTAARLAVEAELRRRGWPAAASPAEADMVVLAGPAGTRLMPMVGRVWRQVPKPRVFVHAGSAATVPQLLDQGCSRLAAGGELRETLAGEQQGGGESHEEHHGGEHDSDSGHGGGNPEGTDVDDGDHESGHGGGGKQGGGDHDAEDGHDHGGGHAHHHGGGMEMPGGLGMADRGPDRDGLRLDQLHVPLGPLLPDWPPGLVVHTTLQGDVIQEARADVLRVSNVHEDFWNEPWHRAAAGEEVTRGEGARRCVAAYLDGLARLLRVAGWPDPATGAGRLRDEVLAGARVDQVRPRLRRWARRLRRARTLRWLTDGLGVLPPDRAEAAGFAGTVLYASRRGGDVTARWQAWLAEIERALPGIDDTAVVPAGEELPHGADSPSVPALAVLPELLEGAELAAARLIVASFDPAVTALDGRTTTEVARG